MCFGVCAVCGMKEVDYMGWSPLMWAVTGQCLEMWVCVCARVCARVCVYVSECVFMRICVYLCDGPTHDRTSSVM